MLSIVKLVLLLLLSTTFASITQNIERILLPTWNPTSAKEIQITLKVFGKHFQLKLHKNHNVSSKFKIWKHDVKGVAAELSQSNASKPCYYFHEDHISTAVINFCQERGWEGLVFLKNDTLEIIPLRDDFASLSLTNDVCVKEDINISFGKSHLIKRSLQLSTDTSFHYLDNFKLKRRDVQNTQEKLTIELAVFFDEATYRGFMSFLGNKERLHLMILAYVNNIQAVFHHPILGVSIDISLVHLEIMDKKQSAQMNIIISDEILLESFCRYANSVNPPNDNDPLHWDIALYLAAVNTESTKNFEALSKTDSVCDSNTFNTSCAIVRFATSGKISSGFTSSLIAAREIGHVLGLQNDSMPCDKDMYIMSSRKLNYGQITWSRCNRLIAQELRNTKKCLQDRKKPINLEDAYDHSRYNDLPGRQWTAKEQCEIYFRDKDANVVSLLDICNTLQCERPHDNVSYFTGPALEGTHCADKKECRGGECVPIIEPPYNFKYCGRDNWSEWKEDTCQSGCMHKSKGAVVKRRSCKHGNHRTANCNEPYYDVALCNDSMLCNEKRTSFDNFTLLKCTEISNILKDEFAVELAADAGLQILYTSEEPWKACTLHCALKYIYSYYAPRWELLSIGIDPYLPDGTWCHKDKKNGQNYYCRQHYCLPESYSQV